MNSPNILSQWLMVLPSVCLGFLFSPVAQAQPATSVREIVNQESDRSFRDTSSPSGTSFSLFVGGDVGIASVQPTDPERESAKMGYHAIPKLTFNLGVENVSLDLSGGFALGEVSGDLDRIDGANGQLQDIKNPTLQTQSVVGDFAARWKFGSSLSGFELGGIGQAYFTGDSSFASQTKTTTNAVFGGASAVYQWNAGALIRLGLNGLIDVNLFERTVLLGLVSLQVGFNVVDPNTKVREKSSMRVRESKRQVQVEKPVEKIVVKENVRFLFEEQVINFEFDKATLTPRSRLFLSRLGQFLLRNNESQDGLQVEGHTDNRGSQEYNLKLSEARARSVKEVLESTGLNGQKFRVQGFGFSKPIDPQNNELAFAKNRRVEILFMGVREPSRLREFIDRLKTEVQISPRPQ